MKRTRLPGLVLLALALPAWAACGDDGGSPDPELFGLEPAAVVDAIAALVRPLDGVAEVTTNINAAFDDLRAEGVQLETDPPAVSFPPGLLGTTFRYVPTEAGWAVDESRTGAPVDGVRVLWYQLDGSGSVAEPLQEQGHVDLTGGTSGGLEELRIAADLVRTSSETIRLLDFIQGLAVTGTTSTFEAAGLYADLEEAIDFTIDSEETGTAGSSEYAVDVALAGAPGEYRFQAEGAGTTPGGGFQDDIRAEALVDGAVTVVEVSISGVGPEREVGGTLSHGGNLVATLSADGTLYTFTDPDGRTFPPVTTSQLNNLVRTMLVAGLEPVTRLPLLLP